MINPSFRNKEFCKPCPRTPGTSSPKTLRTNGCARTHKPSHSHFVGLRKVERSRGILHLVGEFLDVVISSAKERRPALARLRAFCRKHSVEAVAICQYDWPAPLPESSCSLLLQRSVASKLSPASVLAPPTTAGGELKSLYRHIIVLFYFGILDIRVQEVLH